MKTEFVPYLHLWHITYFRTKNTKLPQEVYWHAWPSRDGINPPTEEDVIAFNKNMHPTLEYDHYEFKYIELQSEKYH